jgi:hypothetical protein
VQKFERHILRPEVRDNGDLSRSDRPLPCRWMKLCRNGGTGRPDHLDSLSTLLDPVLLIQRWICQRGTARLWRQVCKVSCIITKKGLVTLAFVAQAITMGQSFGNQFTLVEVATNHLVRGVAKRQLWVAAAKPEQAVPLVLSAVPVGWAATLADERLKPERRATLNLQPGEVRQLTN